MDIPYSIPKHAEVISSIGVALAMIRDVVERVIPNPTTEDISRIKREAKALAIKNGAVPDTIEVQVEIDPQTSRVTAIALGSTEVQTTDLSLQCSEEDARKIAAESMRAKPEEVKTLAKNDTFYVFGRLTDKEKQQVRLVDKRGFIRVQCGDAVVATCKASEWETVTKKIWDAKLSYENQMLHTPNIFLCIGGKVLDFSNTIGFEQLITIMKSEFLEAEPDEDIILISARNEIL